MSRYGTGITSYWSISVSNRPSIRFAIASGKLTTEARALLMSLPAKRRAAVMRCAKEIATSHNRAYVTKAFVTEADCLVP